MVDGISTSKTADRMLKSATPSSNPNNSGNMFARSEDLSLMTPIDTDRWRKTTK
jgi:hypothetical protein